MSAAVAGDHGLPLHLAICSCSVAVFLNHFDTVPIILFFDDFSRQPRCCKFLVMWLRNVYVLILFLNFLFDLVVLVMFKLIFFSVNGVLQSATFHWSSCFFVYFPHYGAGITSLHQCELCVGLQGVFSDFS